MTTCCLCTASPESFFGKYQITQVTQASYCPDLESCDIWLFPKLESPLKGKRFQTISENQEYTIGAADGDQNCVRSQGAYFEGDWGIIVLYTMFLVSLINVSYFSYYMTGYLLDRLHKIYMFIYVCVCVCVYLRRGAELLTSHFESICQWSSWVPYCEKMTHRIDICEWGQSKE